jgi:hypothetical protein
MVGSIEVVLIDGCGRPRIVPLAGNELPPYVGYANEGIRSGPDRIARFDHCPDLEVDGRPVYRQLRGPSAWPLIRYEYLTKTPIAPFNTPRLDP